MAALPAPAWSPADEAWMAQALAHAEAALDAGEVPVGCVVVAAEGSTALGAGRNDTNASHNPTRHAEMVAFESVPAGSLRGATLYVTVEPCIMCAAACDRVGIGRIVFGCCNEKFGGCGSVMDVLNMSGSARVTTVQSGLQAAAAVALLKAFYGRPNSRTAGASVSATVQAAP